MRDMYNMKYFNTNEKIYRSIQFSKEITLRLWYTYIDLEKTK